MLYWVASGDQSPQSAPAVPLCDPCVEVIEELGLEIVDESRPT